MKTITATELARNFRQYLDQVEFHGEELVVVRNNHAIAKITPGAARMTAQEALGDLYRTLPPTAGRDWLKHSREAAPDTLASARDPWAT